MPLALNSPRWSHAPGGRQSSRKTTDLNPDIAGAGIVLYDEAGFPRGYAYFYPDGTALTPASSDEDTIGVYYNLSQLAAVLQMVREERPLYVFDFGSGNAGLETGSEPTGEEEGISG
jgi:hypothetical protein